MHKSITTLLREYREAREALERRKAEEFPPGTKVEIPSMEEEHFLFGIRQLRSTPGVVTASISDPDKVIVALQTSAGLPRSFPIDEVERL